MRAGPTEAVERAAAIAFASVRLVFCLYRAADQSITIDEAYTYLHFLRGPWSDIYRRYDANNHVLYSILAKLSVEHLGLSEFSLRLPSLLAGFFLTLGIFELLRLCTRSIAVRWLAFVALSFHPLLLDFSIAARGYGMALAFLVWAIFFCMRHWFFLSGVLIGLALSANLTMAFPAAGLFAAMVLLDACSLKDRLRNLAVMIAPAETIFVAICFGALRTAEPGLFYFGTASSRESIENLVQTSLRATRRTGVIGGDSAQHVFQLFVLPLILVLIVAAVFLSLRRDPKDRLRLLPIFTFAIASAAVLAAHALLNVLYPLDRTGLYLIVLFAVSWAIAADAIPKFRATSLVLGAIMTLQFLTQLHGGYFTVWEDGSRIKDTVGLLTRLSRRRPAESVRVSTSWYHQPAVEFYRERWNIRQWAPVEYNRVTQFTGYDFYIFKDEDPQAIRNAGIRVLFRDSRTSLTVGMNLPAQLAP